MYQALPALPYCKRQKAGRWPGNEAIHSSFTSHDLKNRRFSSYSVQLPSSMHKRVEYTYPKASECLKLHIYVEYLARGMMGPGGMHIGFPWTVPTVLRVQWDRTDRWDSGFPWSVPPVQHGTVGWAQVGQWIPMVSPTCPTWYSGVGPGGTVDSNGQSHLYYMVQWGGPRWDSGFQWSVPPVLHGTVGWAQVGQWIPMVSPTCTTCSLIPRHSVGQDRQVRCGGSSVTSYDGLW